MTAQAIIAWAAGPLIIAAFFWGREVGFNRGYWQAANDAEDFNDSFARCQEELARMKESNRQEAVWSGHRGGAREQEVPEVSQDTHADVADRVRDEAAVQD